MRMRVCRDRIAGISGITEVPHLEGVLEMETIKTRVRRGDSPLDVLERSFDLLIAGPRPLAVNGRRLGYGLPARPVTIPELRDRLPRLPVQGRDVVWRELIRLARTGQERWVVVCAGL